MSSSAPPLPDKSSTRLVSLDAYRGFAMLLMAMELLQLPRVARQFPDSAVWQWISFHSRHVAWTGCSLHDLIQPSFSFMVGVALPFSLAARLRRGDPRAKLWAHTLWRSLLLVLLGVFLRSVGQPMTNWTFEDTLSQIGLGYPFLFALGFASQRVRWIAFAAILIAYWSFFALHPLPPQDFDWAKHHGREWFEGFRAHWNRNGNAAWAFDRWFLNLFPRGSEFLGNGGGYSTLNFIPTLATMILGLIAGERFRRLGALPKERTAAARKRELLWLGGAGVLGIASGWLLDVTGVCPSVKAIWTPSWTLFSGGWCFLLMAAFFFLGDVAGKRGWLYPLVVIGMNSIAMYVLVHLAADFVADSLRVHLGRLPFLFSGGGCDFMRSGAAVLLVFWLILWWMHRRRIYLKI